MELHSITPAEWEVMRVVWSKKQTTSREIITTLSEILSWKEGTIKSLINRLVQKGYLQQQTEQKPMLYVPTIDCHPALNMSLTETITRSCCTERAAHIADLIETQPLSQQNCDDLIAQLQRIKQTAPEKVTCLCPKGQCACHHHE